LQLKLQIAYSLKIRRNNNNNDCSAAAAAAAEAAAIVMRYAQNPVPNSEESRLAKITTMSVRLSSAKPSGSADRRTDPVANAAAFDGRARSHKRVKRTSEAGA